jgi:hypothetical protein
MSIFQKIQDRIKNPALAELVKEQNLKDLLIRREFRLSESYLQREFVTPALDDEIPQLSIALFNGYGEITGKMKKRLLPTISFSATFTIQGMEFSSARKCVFLRLEKVAPFVERIPFLSCTGNMITCDLTRVPKLAELFAYRVKGISAWDFITLKELSLKDGEIVGRVGVVL